MDKEASFVAAQVRRGSAAEAGPVLETASCHGNNYDVTNSGQ